MSQGFQAFDVDNIVFPSAMRVVRPVLPVSVLARSRLRHRITFEWCAPARRAAYRSLPNKFHVQYQPNSQINIGCDTKLFVRWDPCCHLFK